MPFAADAGALAALGGQDVGVAGVGVAPAQVSLQLAAQHGVAGMIRSGHDKVIHGVNHELSAISLASSPATETRSGSPMPLQILPPSRKRLVAGQQADRAHPCYQYDKAPKTLDKKPAVQHESRMSAPSSMLTTSRKAWLPGPSRNPPHSSGQRSSATFGGNRLRGDRPPHAARILYAHPAIPDAVGC